MMSDRFSKLGRPDGSSTFRTVVNLVMSAIGVSIFALPECFHKSGAVSSLVLLVFTAALSQYMMHLLYLCMTKYPEAKSYPELGLIISGRFAKLAVSISMYSGIIAISGGLIMLMGEGLHNLTNKSLTEFSWTLISAVILLPLSLLPSFKEIGIVSIIGVIALVATLITVVAASAKHMTDYPNTSSQSSVNTTSPDYGVTLVTCFNRLMNSFTVAPVIPSLVSDMQDPRKYFKASSIGFACIALIAGITGFSYIGFATEYDQGNATSVFGVISSEPSLQFYATAAQLGTVVICMSHFLCMFAPIASLVDSLSDLRVIKIVARVLAVMVCCGIAVTVRQFGNFGKLMGIVGCLIVPFVQLIFPVVFYYLATRSGRSYGQTVMLAAVFLVGIAAFGVGILGLNS